MSREERLAVQILLIAETQDKDDAQRSIVGILIAFRDELLSPPFLDEDA